MTEQEYLDMYEVVGVAFDVYNELGRGMAEPIYQEALAIEFNLRGMKAIREKKLSLSYKGIPIEHFYKADFYYKDIVIEIGEVWCQGFADVVKNLTDVIRQHRHYDTWQKDEVHND